MLALSASAIVKEFGGRRVLDGTSLELPARARIGLIGHNGAGKSTLIRILCGLEPADAGTVALRKGARIGFAAQIVAGDHRTALATIEAGRPETAELDAELARVEASLGDPAVIADLDKMARILERQAVLIDEREALGKVSGEGLRIARELGLDEATLAKATTDLSGGQRKLVALAAALASGPDVLILDEPEAHLDLRRRALLEERIRQFEGAVLIICHDRYLLDETVDTIAVLERGKIRTWPGNYSAYQAARELERERQARVYSAEQQEIARLEAAVRRYRAWAKQVLSKRHKISADNIERRIDRMDKVERPVLVRRKMALELHAHKRGGDRVVALESADGGYGEDPVLLDVDLELIKGERVGVIGPNGGGKSTLIRILAGEIPPLGGVRKAGPSTQVGYLSQTVDDLSDPDQTPVDAVQEAVRGMTPETAVSNLLRVGFDYEQARRPLATLSGGERTRLGLLRLMLGGANFLILDEPTNHLDVDAIESLESALESYDGTVIAVSHDRYFLDRLVDRLLVVGDGEVASFDGGYSRWLERVEAQAKTAS